VVGACTRLWMPVCRSTTPHQPPCPQPRPPTTHPTSNTNKQTMCQASLSEVLVYMGIWHPWPLSEPEMRMRALGLDLLSTEGAMIVTLQDMGDELPVSARLAAAWVGRRAVRSLLSSTSDYLQPAGGSGVQRPTTPLLRPHHPSKSKTSAQSIKRPTQAGLTLPPGAATRTRYKLFPSCIRFEPLGPDPVTGKPRLDVTCMCSLDMTGVPDGIISFLLKVGGCGGGWVGHGGSLCSSACHNINPFPFNPPDTHTHTRAPGVCPPGVPQRPRHLPPPLPQAQPHRGRQPAAAPPAGAAGPLPAPGALHRALPASEGLGGADGRAHRAQGGGEDEPGRVRGPRAAEQHGVLLRVAGGWMDGG